MSRLRTRKNQQNAPMIVVAGGAGFIGSHLSEALLNSGAHVLGLDDLVTGSMANIASFRRHANYEFFECNVNQAVPQALFDKPITHIVHVMGMDTHAPNADATLSSLLTGAFGTKNLLDLAVKTGARFVLASTITVYEGMVSSTSLDHYFGATDNQRAQYSQNEAKRYAEGLCQMYADEFNLDVRVARLSSVYGPRMDLCDSTFLDKMIQSTLDGLDLIVEEDGNQEIYLTYVEDVVFGLTKLLFADGEQFKQAIYPLVSPEKTSILSVAYTLRTFLPPGKEIKFLSESQGEHFRLPAVAFERTKRDLDWEPTVNLTEGLRATIESFRKGTSQPIRQHKIGRSQLQTILPAAEAPKLKPAAAVQMHEQNAVKEGGPAPESTPSLVNLIPEVSAPAEAVKLPFRGEAAKPDTQAKPTEEAAKTKANDTTTPSSKTTVRSKRKSWWRRLFLVAVLLGAYGLIGRPLVHTVVYSAGGGIALKQAADQAKALDFSQAEATFGGAREHFLAAERSAEGLSLVLRPIGLTATQEELEKGLSALAAAADGLSTLSKAAKPWPDHLQRLVQWEENEGKPLPIAELVKETQVNLHQGQKQFGQALTQLSGSTTKVAGAAVGENGEEIGEGGLLSGLLAHARSLLSQAQVYLLQAEQALEVMPEALGANNRRQYLVMFQNSNELRPTGGFMGSYALITFEQGSITDLKIDDIYNPDGKLQSEIAAPAPLSKQLGVGSMFIRDANWSADVTASADLVEQLYTKATKEPVDGVIFVTTKAIEPLLRELGPIHLTNFNETVTAENFTMLAQAHSNVNFIAGSTNKRDFLGVLAEALLARLSKGEHGDWLQAAQALSQGLTQKEIQANFDSPALQLLADQYDWSGRMKSTDGDYLRVVDANIGANKSNYYITRSTEYSINVDRDSHLNSVVKISWKHTGTSGTWPGGDYNNYVRVYVPAGAVLIGSNNFNPDTIVDSYSEGDKQVFGGYVSIPYGSEKTVELSYRLPDRLGVLESNGEYRLLWQKQSGVGEEPLKVAFNAPLFLTPEQIVGGGTLSDGSVVWHKTGLVDHTMSAHLEQR